MGEGINYKNTSGCADPTAYEAISGWQREQDERDERARKLIKAIKTTIDLSGYTLLERIEIEDRQTKRQYR